MRWGLLLATSLVAACGEGPALRFIEAPWSPDSTLVVFAATEVRTIDLARPPAVVSGAEAIELDLELDSRVERLEFLEFEVGTRAALGIERCGVALDGTLPALPDPDASFSLLIDGEHSAIFPAEPNWGEQPPRYRGCAPTHCDSIDVSSNVLPDLEFWRVQDIEKVDETHVVVSLGQTSSVGPGLLLLVERPSQILRRIDLPVRLSGMTRLEETMLLTTHDGALYRSDTRLTALVEHGAVPRRLTLEPEPGGRSAIGFSIEHEDAVRIHVDGRVEPAPAHLLGAFHALAFGSDQALAAVRSSLPTKSKDPAVSFYDGSGWTRLALPADVEEAEQLRFEDRQLRVLTKKALLTQDERGGWRRHEHVPAPFGQNFLQIAPLGRGHVLSGHGGLLERVGPSSHCELSSENHETISALTAMSDRTVVGGWKFTRSELPNLMWIDDQLPEHD